MRPFVALTLAVVLGWSYPVLAYRTLVSVPTEVSSGPVQLIGVSSSLQDTKQSLNSLWDTTLTLRREPTPDLRLISEVELELLLMGSQGETIERVVTRVSISGIWQNNETRQVRLVRSYLGWPATGLQGRVLQVKYATGEPWLEPVTTVVTTDLVPPDESEEVSINPSAADTPYIPPTVLGTGGSSGGGGSPAPAVRPTRPRAVRPRPTAAPAPSNQSINGNRTATPPSPFAPSIFSGPGATGTSTNGNTNSNTNRTTPPGAPVPGSIPIGSSPPQPGGDGER
ncbi:hypothetical protein [Candidatus Cyanaurora vandensis]|uniref:hypothetical protein n=1 Tax=Candidatus Cyanaurora vandensis TaxID=2714958 RepID=UPI0025800D42|nr:hypothetical protein [Candidatus Cyanaurora vandensis]